MFTPPRLSLPHLYVVWVFLILATWLLVLAAGGLADAWLAATGRQTVSEFVWAHPWAGVPIVLFSLIGPAFLALHFWFGVLKP